MDRMPSPPSDPSRVTVTVIRHRKERLAKCSLTPLRERPEIAFIRERDGLSFDATGYTLLQIDAPVLGPGDADRPLLILDSSWRWLPALRRCVSGDPIPRSLPGAVTTAYPRTTKLFEDPRGGLASVEALYLAKVLLGEDDPTLLEGYRWAGAFREREQGYLNGAEA